MRLWPPKAGRILHSPPVEGAEPAGLRPRALAVTSGKGGVGKTSISVNLAISLAQMGQRVTLFDADLGMANAEVLMGLVPPYSLYDVLYGGLTIEEVAVRGPLGINVISGGSGLVEMANLDRERRRHLLDVLSRAGRDDDFIIVDTGAGIGKNVLGFVAAAREVIVVITPEPTSLTDAYALIKVLDRFDVHREVGVVVNRAADQREAGRVFGRLLAVVERFLSIKLNSLGWIPEDRAVALAVKNQQPFVLANPASAASRSMAGVAGALLQKETPAAAGGFWSRLIRLFG